MPDLAQYRVIALVRADKQLPNELHRGCRLLRADFPWPAIYHSVFGPASEADCGIWIGDHCGGDVGGPIFGPVGDGLIPWPWPPDAGASPAGGIAGRDELIPWPWVKELGDALEPGRIDAAAAYKAERSGATVVLTATATVTMSNLFPALVQLPFFIFPPMFRFFIEQRGELGNQVLLERTAEVILADPNGQIRGFTVFDQDGRHGVAVADPS